MGIKEGIKMWKDSETELDFNNVLED